MIRAAALLVSLVLATPTLAAEDLLRDPENTVYLDLDGGRVVIAMRPDLAPRHVARLKHLIRGGYYDGLVFHRVIEDFAAQTGDPRGDGTGAGTGRTLNAEFSRTPQVRGTVSMARGSRRNSADAEWFIVLGNTSNTRSALDGRYTVWGQVVSGMEFVDAIPKGDPRNDGRGIVNPGRIHKMQIAADAEATTRETDSEILARSESPAVIRDFSAAEFKCAGLLNGDGVTTQSAIARLWTHGYLAGRFTAENQLTFDAAAPSLDEALAESCRTYPYAFLLTVASQEVAKAPRPLPTALPAFPLEGYSCKAYVAARKARNKDESEIPSLWAFAFIQGFKNVSQPEMEIPFESGPRLLEALTTTCAQNQDFSFAEITGAVAARVRIK